MLRRSLPLFPAVVAGLAIWQTRLTWLLMEQDRNLAAQRSRELDTLPPPAALKAKLPPGCTLILLKSGSVMIYPGRPLLFEPDPASASGAPSRQFDSVERLEFRDQRHDQAIPALRPLVAQATTRPRPC
ncbi:MAG: hypothetical protein M3Y07_05560, partial [Acidobacteriota bacterium]|nr:hypothetical protein [Acidobacteriota bacterium]